MAGSTDPPKPKRGRRRGSYDKERDYPVAVAKMRALISGGTKPKAAARAVSAEMKIPLSTLRRHLASQRMPWDLESKLEIRPLVEQDGADKRKLE